MAVDYRFQPKGLKSNLGWYDRGYIPHFEGGEIAQFITFRLADSMPAKVLGRWRKELDQSSEQEEALFRKRIERYLDQGYGACWLKDPRIADMVEETLLLHNGRKYTLIAWVIMPNHVHALLRPLAEVELGAIAHSLKSFAALQANRILERNGRFWQPEVFDRYIRNRNHFQNVIKYIESNPVKAGLCREPPEWRYSSAHWKAQKVK